MRFYAHYRDQDGLIRINRGALVKRATLRERALAIAKTLLGWVSVSLGFGIVTALGVVVLSYLTGGEYSPFLDYITSAPIIVFLFVLLYTMPGLDDGYYDELASIVFDRLPDDEKRIPREWIEDFH